MLEVGISPSFNGRERMDVIGTVIRIFMQLEVDISPSFNGRERMDVIGETRHFMYQDFAVTQM
jgi:hypothetical protein